MLILTQPLNYGGRLYEVGDNVRGRLPLDVIAQLQAGGHIEEIDPVNAEGGEAVPPSGEGEGGQSDKPPRGRRNAQL